MADVFISYSKQSPKYTISLAKDLELFGFSVWWDTSLLPGDEFPDLIKQQIDAAKAVVVIWTPSSVKSKWVRAEAQRADTQGKLITVHAPRLDLREIPLPFNTLHSEPVTDRAKLLASIRAKVTNTKNPGDMQISMQEPSLIKRFAEALLFGPANKNSANNSQKNRIAYPAEPCGPRGSDKSSAKR